MRMTYASFMQFYENVDMSMLWRICHHRGTKRVPRQLQRKWWHGNIPMIRQLIEIPVQKSKCADVRNMQKMVGWSRLPDSHGSTAWQTRRNVHEANGHDANIRFISDNMHSSMSHRVGGYTFQACNSWRVELVQSRGSRRSRGGRSGSSCTRILWDPWRR